MPAPWYLLRIPASVTPFAIVNFVQTSYISLEVTRERIVLYFGGQQKPSLDYSKGFHSRKNQSRPRDCMGQLGRTTRPLVFHATCLKLPEVPD